MAHPAYRPDIDGLRAVAVFSVVVFHAYPDRFKGGFIGVDIFFVISGFLISLIILSNLEKGAFSYREFYIRRARRIFPALSLILFSSLVMGWFLLMPDEYMQLGKHVASGTTFISNFVLWGESGYFDSAADAKVLLHLWSLAIEEQFYIFWPLILGVLWRRQWNFLRVMALLALASFVINVVTARYNATAAFYSPLSRFWELMVGGMLAYVTLHRSARLARHKNVQSVLGFVLLGAGFLFINRERLFPSWWALLPTCGAFLIISAGPQAWLNKTFLSNRWAVWLGLISYPLYLWHWLGLFVYRELEADARDAGIAQAAKLVTLLLCVLLSWVTLKWIERPLRFGRQPPVMLVLFFAVMGLAGWSVWRFQGVDQRDLYQPVVTGKVVSLSHIPHEHLAVVNPRRTDDRQEVDRCALLSADKRSADYVKNNCYREGDLLLVGDSHAASLYPALKTHLAAYGHPLSQMTAAYCLPVVQAFGNGMGAALNERCADINRYIIDEVQRHKPKAMIVSAYYYQWGFKHDPKWTDPNYVSNLEEQVRALTAAGVPVILVGQFPIYDRALPKILATEFQGEMPPSPRGQDGLVRPALEVDKVLAAMAKRSGAHYISVIDHLCNAAEGCLRTVPLQGVVEATSFDYGHLSEAGAEYVAESLLVGRIHAILNQP